MASLWIDLAQVLVTTLAFSMLAVLLLWLASIPLRDASIIDMFFALIMFAVTVLAYWFGDGAPVRQHLVLLLVGLWAVRISIHLIKRNWGRGEDPRYSKLRSWVADDKAFVWLSLRKVFLLQGAVMWIASLPVQFAQTVPTPASLGWPAYLGIGLWMLGLVFESVSDFQLTRFQRSPENKNKVLSTGLWRYSRHPNYFGELCVWWGLFLIACDHPLGLVTVVGPAVYTYLIINVTGQRTLDKKLLREKPDYAAYMETTSGLIPLLPRSPGKG